MSVNISKMSLEEKKRLYNQLVKDLPSPDESYESESEDQLEAEPEDEPEPKKRAPIGSNKKKAIMIIKRAPTGASKNKVIEEIEEIEEDDEEKPKIKRNNAKKKDIRPKQTKFQRMKSQGKFEEIKTDRDFGAPYKMLATKYDCSIDMIKKILDYLEDEE
jgi:hypothetical protein